MKIKGMYVRDCNFIKVFANNRIYTIARNTGDWGSVGVDERTATGPVLDQATYDKWEAECSREGEFELS